MYIISPKVTFSKISFRLISDIYPFNFSSFYYLKAPILKYILKYTFIN